MVLFHSVLNLVILTLLLVFAFDYQVPRNGEYADARRTLAYYLFGSDDGRSTAFSRTMETIDDLANDLERTVRAYYAVPTRSHVLFMHYTAAASSGEEDSGHAQDRRRTSIAPPQLLIQYYRYGDDSTEAPALVTEIYLLTVKNPIGPFAKAATILQDSRASCTARVDTVAGGAFIPCRVSAAGELLDRVVQLRLSLSLFSRARRWSSASCAGAMLTIPTTWSVDVDYGFAGHKALLSMSASVAGVSRREPERRPVLVLWLLCTVTLLDLHWRVRSLLKERVVAVARQELRRRPTTSVQEGGWRWLGLLSNCVVITLVATGLTAQYRTRTSEPLEEAATLLLAFAAMLSCFRVVVLLKLFPTWYVLIDGLATALQQLSVLAVGVLPVLVGYSVCGTAAFGGFSGSTAFASLPDALVTMVCSMFGDNLLDTFLAMDQSPHRLLLYFARFFMVTFMMLFVCNILNIAHSIIQDSYSQAMKSYADAASAPATTMSTTSAPSSPSSYPSSSSSPDLSNMSSAGSQVGHRQDHARQGHRRRSHTALRADEVAQMLHQLNRVSLQDEREENINPA